MFHVDGMYQGGSRLPYLGPSDSVTAECPKNETPTMPRVEPMRSARPTTGRLSHELGSYWRDGFHGRGSRRFMARPPSPARTCGDASERAPRVRARPPPTA